MGIPDVFMEMFKIPTPESVKDWANGTMWILLTFYILCSYFYKSAFDENDSSEFTFEYLSINGIIFLIVLPAHLFIISIWPVLKLLRIVKKDHEFEISDRFNWLIVYFI